MINNICYFTEQVLTRFLPQTEGSKIEITGNAVNIAYENGTTILNSSGEATEMYKGGWVIIKPYDDGTVKSTITLKGKKDGCEKTSEPSILNITWDKKVTPPPALPDPTPTPLDQEPPSIPGEQKYLVISDLHSTGSTIKWNRASDTISENEDIEYGIFYEQNDVVINESNIISDNNQYGIFVPNTYKTTISRLVPNMICYVKLMVRDRSGNSTEYETLKFFTGCEGLLGYYPLNGNSYDASERRNNPERRGKGQYITDRYNQGTSRAYNILTEKSALRLPFKINQVQNETNGATFTAWVNPAKMDKTNYRYCVISTDNDGYDWALYINNKKLGVFTGESAYDSERTVYENQWQFIAVVFNPGKNKIVLYYNNTQKAEVNEIQYSRDTDNVIIGSHKNGKSFVGGIDDVRIYERVLSEDEIRMIYSMEEP